MCPDRPVVLIVLLAAVLDEEHREGPEHDTAEEGDGVEDEAEVALEHLDNPRALGHLLHDVGSLRHQVVVVLGWGGSQ